MADTEKDTSRRFSPIAMGRISAGISAIAIRNLSETNGAKIIADYRVA